jgi:hypothetical protein
VGPLAGLPAEAKDQDEEGEPAENKNQRSGGIRTQSDGSHWMVTLSEAGADQPQIFSMDWEGNRTAIAGWVGDGPAPEDGSALGTKLNEIQCITTAPNGDVYFVQESEDDGHSRYQLTDICKVTLDGRIETVVARIEAATALAFSPTDKLLYFAQANPLRLNEIHPDGRHRVIYRQRQKDGGTGRYGSCASIEFTPGGDLVFEECLYLEPAARINVIQAGERGVDWSDRTVLTLAGEGTQTRVSAPGLPILARDARLFYPRSLQVGPKGEIYFIQDMPLDPRGNFGSQLCKITATGHLVRVAGGGAQDAGDQMCPALEAVLEGDELDERIVHYRVLPSGGIVLVIDFDRLALLDTEEDQVLAWLVRRGQEQIRMCTRPRSKDGGAVLAAPARLRAVLHVIQTGLFKYPNFMLPKHDANPLRKRETGSLRGSHSRRLEVMGDSVLDTLRARAALARLTGATLEHRTINMEQLRDWSLQDLRDALPLFPRPQTALEAELVDHDRRSTSTTAPPFCDWWTEAEEGKEEKKERIASDGQSGPQGAPSSTSSPSPAHPPR